MGMFVEGEWVEDQFSANKDGHYKRPRTQFRDWIRADGSTSLLPAADRYHLYASYACPWSHRTLIMRKLKGLERVISVSSFHPFMGDRGWSFGTDDPRSSIDHVLGQAYISEVYLAAAPKFTGRATLPVLWDRETETIVSNESVEIVRMMDLEFEAFAENPDRRFHAAELSDCIEAAIAKLYPAVNNGVYRAGFARTQEAYELAVNEVFAGLDHWDSVLSQHRYICGEVMTEADICFFTTLIRFDVVYHGHFKCNRRRITDYEHLWPYLRDMFQTPGIADTVDLDHIRTHYYSSHESINPRRIIAVGPEFDLHAPHGRG